MIKRIFCNTVGKLDCFYDVKMQKRLGFKRYLFVFDFVNDFYRAMLRIARTLLSQVVCPSVTCRYFIETAKHVTSFISPSGFTVLNVITTFRREPPNGDVECSLRV